MIGVRRLHVGRHDAATGGHVRLDERLQDVARDYADRGVRFLQINANDAVKHPRDSLEAMKTRVDAGEFATPYLHDETQEVAEAYGAARTPEVFLFDGEHRLVYHGTPDSDHQDPGGAEPYLRDAIDAVLEDGTPAVQDVPAVGCTIKWR